MPDKSPNSNRVRGIFPERFPDLSVSVMVSGLTVNQPSYDFEGSSPSFPTTLHLQLLVAGPPKLRQERRGTDATASPMTGSSGVSSRPRPFDSITGTSEYWVARSSGARRPGMGARSY